MPRPYRAAFDLIGEARQLIASSMDPPKRRQDNWAAAAHDMARASRSVGEAMRSAMDQVESELQQERSSE